MKKRLPILMVFGAALLTGVILYFAGGTSAPQELDTDKDGFPDSIDKCKTEYSNKNSGCPEAVQSGEDKDKDGRFAEFQKDTALFDQNDNNACIPNPTCDFCDQDGDGLTYPQERAKMTDPTLKDSDGDGINDRLDSCPDEYGVADNKGCKMIIDAMLRKKGNTINWNPMITNHAQSVRLIVTKFDGTIAFNNNVLSNSQMIGNITRGVSYSAELIIILKNPRGISIINTIIKC